MKAKILAGLVAAGLLGGTAMAHDGVMRSSDQPQKSPDNIGGAGLDKATPQEINDLQQADVAPPPVDMSMQGQGVGGSGDVKNMNQQEGIGGSGTVNAPVPPPAVTPPPAPPAPVQKDMSSCAPASNPATGGSGVGNDVAAPPPASALEPTAPLQRDYDTLGRDQVSAPPSDAFAAPPKKMSKYDYKMRNADEGQKKGDMRGLTLLVGAGVEGYTGGLASEVNPGAALGVTAALKPTKVLGIELGYSGAVNNLSTAVGGSGPDIIRNGGQAALTLGLTAAPIQPYVMGGFGLSYYNVRHGEELGFHSDTNRTIPVGVGLRTHIHDFTADARVNYNVLLDNGFASDVTNNLWTGRYTGTLNLGGTF